MKQSYLLSKLTFLLLFFVAITQNLQAQTSASGQVKIITPTTLSACNTDTIFLELTNVQGAKGVTYAGNVSMEIDIPGGTLMKYIDNSIISTPTGVSQTSYAGNKLTIALPLPAFGKTTKLQFLVQPDCNVGALTPLPSFKVKTTYPSGYPIATETIKSAAANVGKGELSVSGVSGFTNALDPWAAVGITDGLKLTNTGYGDIKEVTIKFTFPNEYVSTYGIFTAIVIYDANVVNQLGANPWLPYGVGVPTSGNRTIYTAVIKGDNLGSDNVLSSGEILSLSAVLNAPQQCGQFKFDYEFSYTCGPNTPSCQIPVKYTSTRTVQAGTPTFSIAQNTFEKFDGCAKKKVKYTYTNTGVGNGAPVGSAYDVSILQYIGAPTALITNLKINGTAVPTQGTYGLPAPNTLFNRGLQSPVVDWTMIFKNVNTNPAYGFADLDGDGFYDDLKAGNSLTIEFEYTSDIQKVCGGDMSWNFYPYVTYTDACGKLAGSNFGPQDIFGLKQTQPIAQTSTNSFTGTPNPETQTAKFEFGYQTINFDLTAATGKLKVRWSERFEFKNNSVLLNGAALTNPTATILGAPGAEPASGADTGMDSVAVYTLTTAEVATLLDGVLDKLEYQETYFACDKRQPGVKQIDTWSICMAFNAGPCPAAWPDGTTSPREFDLGCSRVWNKAIVTGCSGKPFIDNYTSWYRTNHVGHTNVSETSNISPIDSARSYICDTTTIKTLTFVNGDWAAVEPNGTYTDQGTKFYDAYSFFNIVYPSNFASLGKATFPMTFIPGESVVTVYPRIPDPTDVNKLGTIDYANPIIANVPLLLSDFDTQNGYGLTDAFTQNPGTTNYRLDYLPTDPFRPSAINNWYLAGLPFPNIADSEWTETPTATDNVYSTYASKDYSKASSSYYLSWGAALARAGYKGKIFGDDNLAIEINTKWKVNKDYPFDNTTGMDISWNSIHYGDYYYPKYASIKNANLTDASSTFINNGLAGKASHLAVTKEHYIANPKAVYSVDCGTKVSHNVYFKSYQGDYFRNSEVRVPLRIEKIEVEIPTGYTISGPITLKYNQGCAEQTTTTNVVASATSGMVTFTGVMGNNGDTSTDFPRADDCSGNKMAYTLCYNIGTTSSVLATYKMPIKIYTKDEAGFIKILYDTATVTNQRPELVVSPVTPVLSVPDGGACQPAYYDFFIQNTSLTPAAFAYIAAETTGGTTVVNIVNAPGSSAVKSDSVSSYGGSNKFAKLGIISPGDSVRVRVLANTVTCSGDIKVIVDWGCSYPSDYTTLEANSTHEDVVNANYLAAPPKLLAKSVASRLDIIDLCGDKEIEFEVRNADLPNIYKLKAGFKLPASLEFVAGSAMIKHPLTGSFVAVADATIPSADSVVVNYAAVAPFNTPCALTGSDTTAKNNLRIKISVKYKACPTTTSEEILLAIRGENYCGTEATSQAVLPINYIGSAGNQNNYSLSAPSAPLKVCASKNQVQNVSENLYIKNLGGYGAASGLSSGKDSVTFTIIADPGLVTLANLVFAAPFNAPLIGADINGNPTYRMLIPAGIAVGDSLAVPITYDLTPKVDKLCTETTKPVICIGTLFTSPVILECAALGLNCGIVSKAIRGNGLMIRKFECCFGSIGDYVWQDTDKDGQQGLVATEPVIPNIRVYLYQETTSGVYTKFDSTFTGTDGKYLFSNLFAGNYKVQFVAPTSYSLTTLNMGATATDSDAGVNGFSGIVNIDTSKPLGDVGRDNLTIDAGFIACNLSATSATTPPTCPNNDGAINLTVTGATGTPTYKWSNGATTQNLTGLPAGDYTVTVTDGACTATAMTSLNKPNTNIPYAICPGDSYKLEIQDATLTGIQWLKNGVAISGANGLAYTATQVGIYTYTSNGVGGCAVGQCCPIEITLSTNCCKPQICTSVKITKK